MKACALGMLHRLLNSKTIKPAKPAISFLSSPDDKLEDRVRQLSITIPIQLPPSYSHPGRAAVTPCVDLASCTIRPFCSSLGPPFSRFLPLLFCCCFSLSIFLHRFLLFTHTHTLSLSLSISISLSPFLFFFYLPFSFSLSLYLSLYLSVSCSLLEAS